MNTPRTISDSMTAARASASFFDTNVFVGWNGLGDERLRIDAERD
jgi:hypothetical protein